MHSAKRSGIDMMSPRTNFQVDTHLQHIRSIFDRQPQPTNMSPAILPSDTPSPFYLSHPPLYGDHPEPEVIVNEREMPTHSMGTDSHSKKTSPHHQNISALTASPESRSAKVQKHSPLPRITPDTFDRTASVIEKKERRKPNTWTCCGMSSEKKLRNMICCTRVSLPFHRLRKQSDR